MRRVLGVIAVMLLLGCAAHKQPAATSNGERNGASIDSAIVVNEHSETMGVNAEYQWLAQHYPGYKLKGQELLFEKGKPYDLLEIYTSDGSDHKVYFDISNFYGKM